jgi:dihydrofolate synthase/folylpolyglutamate synthase
VHAYTSPHLIKYNERIRVAGKVIDDERLGILIDEVEAANADQEISFFEITTAALRICARASRCRFA